MIDAHGQNFVFYMFLKPSTMCLISIIASLKCGVRKIGVYREGAIISVTQKIILK